MVLPDSVESAVLVTSVEKGDVPLLVNVLSGSLDGREVDKDDSSEASLLVLSSVVDGPGVGPDVVVTSVEMLISDVPIVEVGLLVSLETSSELSVLETVWLASVDRLGCVDMLVSLEMLETDCPDEVVPGPSVDSTRLEESPVLVGPTDAEIDVEPLVN